MRQLRIAKREPNRDERAILADQPEVDDAMGTVLECWSSLDSCRPLGQFGAGAIPYTAIDVWARRRGLDSQAFALVEVVIRHLDSKRAERISSDLALKGTR